jgi:two-component system, cell cycle sensor histidine kinase and response regulator CckA
MGEAPPRRIVPEAFVLSEAIAVDAQLNEEQRGRLQMERVAEATKAFARSLQWLTAALDAGRVGLWEWDLATGELRWSEGVGPLFGLEPGTLRSTFQAYLESIYPDDRARVEEALRSAAADGGEYDIEHRVPTADGGIRWLHGCGRGVRDRKGKVVCMAGSVFDVTDRRRAEEERHLYSLIVERATDFIGLCTLEGRLLYLNDAGLRMVGLRNVDEARTLRVRDLLTPEGIQQALEVELTTVLEEGHWEGDGQLVHLPTGKLIDVETTSFLVPDPTTGRPLCLGTVRRDVTARRALEEQLRQSQKMDVVGHLAAGIAHDFNNLLTIIVGATEFLLAADRLGEETRACIEDIDGAAQRAAALTRQLLAFGRKQVLTPRVLDANEVITETSRLVARLLPATAEMQLALSSEPLPVCVDRSMLEQVVLNLVVNARDAMPKGGTITIRTGAEGATVVLSVADTGVGMTSEVRERAFDPFFTTKANGKGTGLGLSTVYGLVHQSGGEVGVESAPGAGAVFSVRLPRAAEPHEASGALSSPAQSRDARGTLLVVDDEDAVRKTMKRILESAGYTVLEASNGENALRICVAHGDAIDLLVTDLRMPKMDGRELTRRARELRPHMGVLIVTGLADGSPLPSDGVLAKPFSAGGLLARIEQLLEGRKSPAVAAVDEARR